MAKITDFENVIHIQPIEEFFKLHPSSYTLIIICEKIQILCLGVMKCKYQNIIKFIVNTEHFGTFPCLLVVISLIIKI